MWLLSESVKQTIEQAYSNGVLPNAEQQATYEARYGDDNSDSPRIFTVAGDVAQINISGVITSKPSFMAWLFGGGNVTYSEIISALAAADSNQSITRAEIHIDSPGGHFDGLFDAIAAIQAFGKPLQAVVNNQASSAAYAIASQCGKIVANNKAVRVGSIGVVASYYVDESEIDIASSEAPKKRPDPTTESGKAVIREELDAMHSLFVETIANGRGTTPEKVNAEYGQGGVFLADKALKRGMIDSIAGAPLRVVKSANSTTAHGGNKTETGSMDQSNLKAQHPDVYAAVLQEGIDKERDRTVGHLNLAQGSGLMDDAIKAISEGEELTHAVTTKHMMAAVNRRDQANRQDDDAAAAAADGAAGGKEPESQVLALVEANMGIGA